MKNFKKVRMLLALVALIAMASLTSLAVYSAQNSAQNQISLDSPASLPSDI